MKDFNSKKFEEILNSLNIKTGDNLLVNSDILKILVKHRETISPDQIINVLKKKISEKGNLIFPTYNWDFCKGKPFNCLKTKSSSGALSNLSLKMSDFRRSTNPIYSFSTFGKDKDYISTLKHLSCFGLDSPFGYLIKNQGKNLFIGIDYKESLTFVHVAEEQIKVDYRYHKNFEGNYINKNGISTKVNYNMYVRKEDKVISTAIDKKFDDKLLEKNALIKKSYDGISFSVIDIQTTFNLMLDDLKSKSGLIYPNIFK